MILLDFAFIPLNFSFYFIFFIFFWEGVGSFISRVLWLVFFEEFLYNKNKTIRERQREGDDRRFLEKRSKERRRIREEGGINFLEGDNHRREREREREEDGYKES